MNVFEHFQSRIAALIKKRIETGELPGDLDLGRFVVEPPREAAHGDLSTNAAMVYARETKEAGSNPRTLAATLAADLAREPDVKSAEAAGPGFINIVLKPQVYEQVLRTVLIHGTRFGAGARGKEGPVNVEYVSANPTGPMHVGHARGAVFGDALCEPAHLCRPRSDARILCQRRRRPGRRSGALSVPALPRGLGRGHRPDPRGPLSRRLSEAGGRVSRARVRRGPIEQARGDMAAGRAQARGRGHDGDDPRRSRRAQYHPRGVRFRARADRRRRRRGPRARND